MADLPTWQPTDSDSERFRSLQLNVGPFWMHVAGVGACFSATCTAMGRFDAIPECKRIGLDWTCGTHPTLSAAKAACIKRAKEILSLAAGGLTQIQLLDRTADQGVSIERHQEAP